MGIEAKWRVTAVGALTFSVVTDRRFSHPPVACGHGPYRQNPKCTLPRAKPGSFITSAAAVIGLRDRKPDKCPHIHTRSGDW